MRRYRLLLFFFLRLLTLQGEFDDGRLDALLIDQMLFTQVIREACINRYYRSTVRAASEMACRVIEYPKIRCTESNYVDVLSNDREERRYSTLNNWTPEV